jgi:Na+-driven multidrug efflux pump
LLDHARLYVRTWDWRLFLFILLFLGLPNLYQLYRVYLIGNALPDPSGLAVISQWQFVGLVIEVFQEATVLAIFFFLGSQLHSSTAVQLDRTKSVLSFIFVGSLIFSLGVFLFRDAFITIIGTSGEIQAQTRAFLGISIFSVPFTLLSAAILVLLESLRKRGLILVLALSNVLLLFAFDSLFFGGYSFSSDLGVIGAGWSNLLSSVLVFVLGLGLLFASMRLPISSLSVAPSFRDMREYLRVGFGSGLDSLVRNIFYFFMIIKLVNTIGAAEIGGYYLTIRILWSFLLVPVLAFGDSAKVLVANAWGDLGQVRRLWHASMFIIAFYMVVWVALVPVFVPFAEFLNSDAATIRYAVTAFGILFVPYVLFSFNTVMDSVFYGTGQTIYLAYQSIITNGTVYVAAFALYVTGAWAPTFETVMVLFSLGIVVDTILTITFLLKVLYVDPAKKGGPIAVSP